MQRKNTRQVTVGGIPIGGGAPIPVQSMTNTDTRDIDATVAQIMRMKDAGCDIVRMSIYDEACAMAIGEIKRQSGMPLVADIHFDYHLALKAIEQGIDKLRINPGNIGEPGRVRKVVSAAKERNIPIRIGVNAGSLDKKILDKYHGPTPQGMVESAMEHIAILEDLNFDQIVVALKASNVRDTVESYRLMAEKRDYPLHLGVTEAGTPRAGIVKSAIGIGALLLDGIGDTLRVSLTGDVVREVETGIEILRSLGLRRQGMEIVSCPTCGRCNIDLEQIVYEVERLVGTVEAPIKVAIMGCAVNGPGEARQADVGIAGGKDKGVLFKRGQQVCAVPGDQLASRLAQEILEMTRAGSKR
ncbi:MULTISPECIES: flavodoxin-dependent (E)-4-hydroxy-3-methylbut-2-enyl-diphosphate synthase [unclassified Clostridium]|uniref:flavodoxin-dependent (E)-4-hydroxy-3-methylbut-2-enyl-diphosphate synthase n=1 Tax=unclassified Clostridium TaxID=2614128 RepID=UPI0011061D41|nr:MULTISPECIES: flavodoxin-dependent (E)-4-hydroxy-3-methylbut-2-enyl-diphosphate synthase [unclassified Clostridium]